MKRNLPYVYRLTNRSTADFYIGYRCANKKPAEEDIGYHYFSSCKSIKHTFTEYDIEIVAEFFDASAAYDFEQELIFENWGNPKLINAHVVKNGKRQFARRGPLSDAHKQKLSQSLKGREFSNRHRENISKSGKGKHTASDELRRIRSVNASNMSEESKLKSKMTKRNKSVEEKLELHNKLSAVHKGREKTLQHREKIANSNRGKIKSDATKNKQSQTIKNKPRLCCPHCNKIGGQSNMKRYHFDNCKMRPA